MKLEKYVDSRTPSPLEEMLQVMVPKVTKTALKIRSAETGEPMRVIVLRALADIGIEVPEKEIIDRRKNS